MTIGFKRPVDIDIILDLEKNKLKPQNVDCITKSEKNFEKSSKNSLTHLGPYNII